MDRLIKSSFLTPALAQSVGNDKIIQIEPFAKSGETVRNTTHRKNPVVAFVSSLVNRCRPHTVGRFVIAVSIYALNAPAFFSRPHILQKVLKGVEPTVANRDAPSAVVLKAAVLWIRATLNQAKPTNIRFALVVVAASGVAMSQANGWQNINKQASARSGVAPSEIGIDNSDLFSTVTATKAEANRVSAGISVCSGVGQNEKPSKLFPDDVYSSRHGIGSFSALFSGERPATTGAHCDYQRSYVGVN